MTKFSIIIPIFNAGKYLRKCLDSIIKQTINDYEVILIDDGSTDDSSIICDEYSKKDLRFKVLHKKNNGVSSARNEGIKISQGEWLCFVDADDEVKPEWLENYLNNINNETDIIIQGAYIVEDYTRKIQFNNRNYSNNNITELISYWQHNEPDMGSLWTKAIRSTLVKNNNIVFNTNINHFEDWVFFTYCLLYTKNIKTIESLGYIYNHCNSTLTSDKQVSNFEWRLKTFNVRYDAAQQLKKISDSAYWIYMEAISQLMMQTIYQMYKEKYPKQKRIRILSELSQKDINKKKFSLKNWIVFTLWFRNNVFISDLILSLFKLI